MDLSDIRQRIDAVDCQIVELFQQRMELSGEVAESKRGTGKAIYDRDRELEKLKQLGDLTNSEFNRHSVEALFLQIMSISRKYQYNVLGEQQDQLNRYQPVEELPITSQTTVLYQGVLGAWSSIAVKNFFGDRVAPEQLVSVGDFETLVEKVEAGEADYGILPIENSTAGFVNGVYRLLTRYDVHIVEGICLPIRQALLGLQGAKTEEICRVYSHPQALMQSSEYLQAKGWEQISMLNTAVSARKVKEDGDPTHAAVGSTYAAELYGLEVLDPCINNQVNNSTQFVIISKEPYYRTGSDRIAISFTLPHASGTLYNILGHFIFNDINLTSIESEPLEGKPWQYRFYVTFQGAVTDVAVQNAISGVRSESEEFKLLGHYTQPVEA